MVRKAYAARKGNASPKRKARGKKKKLPRARVRAGVATKKRARVVKPGLKTRKRAASKRKNKRSVAKRPAAKKRVAKRPAAKKRSGAGSKKRGRVVRRPVAKRRAGKRRVAKRPAKKRPVHSAASVRKKKRERVQRRLDALEKVKERVRSEKVPRRTYVSKKKVVEEQLAKEHLVERKLPIAPPRARRSATEIAYEHYRTRFNTLLKLAARKKQFPRIDTRERTMSSDKSEGDKRVVNVGEEVTDESVEEIHYQIEQAARSLPGIHPIWTTSFALVAMGDALLGYGQRILEAEDPDAHNFVMSFDSTGVWPTMRAMFTRAKELLEEWAGEQTTIVYLRSFTVQNYHYLRGK